jgi:hypothetical protein
MPQVLSPEPAAKVGQAAQQAQAAQAQELRPVGPAAQLRQDLPAALLTSED